jgi:hypothetical protein
MKSFYSLTASQLRQAADLKEKIQKLQQELESIASGGRKIPAIQIPKLVKRKFSTAGIAKIRAAQKARWAKIHAARPVPIPPVKK